LRRLQRDEGLDIHSFFPRCYVLGNRMSEVDQLKKDYERLRRKQLRVMHNFQGPEQNPQLLGLEDLPPEQSFDGHENLWIAKPNTGTRGNNIQLFSDLNQLLEFTQSEPMKKKEFVVQKYIENPLLVLHKKFDIRQFAMVTSLKPLIGWIFEDCYLRFCTDEYSTNNLTDRFAHLTNHQVNKDSPKYNASANIPEDQWPCSKFKAHLAELKEPGYFENTLRPKIEKIFIQALRSWPQTTHRNFSFEVLGFDIMIDRYLNPWLIEVNANPGLHLNTDIVTPHHTKLQIDTLKVVLDEREKWLNPKFKVGSKIDGWKLIWRDDAPPGDK